MKNIFLKIMMIGLLSFSMRGVVSQVVTSLYFMDNLPQSSILNPAFDPNYNFYIGLPVINNTNMSLSSDIGLSDIYSDDAFFWNSSEAFTRFANALPKTSFMEMEMNTSLFNLGFAVGESGYLHAGITNRSDMVMGIPQEFFKLNDLTVVHDLSGLEMQARMYNEFALGYSYAIDKKLVVGVKFKFLAGVSNASMTFDQLLLTPREEAWEVNMKGAVDISAPVDVKIDSEGHIDDFEETIEVSNIPNLINYATKGYQNPGFGIDLGVEYQVIPRLKLSASIVDLGKINWKRDVTNLNLDGEYTFEGLNDLITTEGEDNFGMDDEVVDRFQDTLQTIVTVDKGFAAFSNSLTPKLFLAAEYELTEALSLGVLYKARFIRDEVKQNVYFNANANFRRILTLGANYNYGIDSQSSYGGVVGVRLSPFYIYLAADVVPGFGSTKLIGDDDVVELPFSMPADLSAVNFQFGINFVLGERRKIVAKRVRRANMPALFDENTENSSVSYPLE